MISDFGLAKRMDQDDGFTMTGAVLGTPSFMSPEQAKGSGAESTTATDIYGIGAILYNMLTGSPPFTGHTQVDTTLKVINDSPGSIRKSNSQVDLDLETICFKCLEKSPQRRYQSAGLLAEDLSRYLEGKPILARRAGTLEQVVKWSRRKPAIASLLAVVAVSTVALIAGLYSSKPRNPGGNSFERSMSSFKRKKRSFARSRRYGSRVLKRSPWASGEQERRSPGREPGRYPKSRGAFASHRCDGRTAGSVAERVHCGPRPAG